MTTLITMESSMTWTMMMTMMVSNINKLILHCTGNFNLSYCFFLLKELKMMRTRMMTMMESIYP